MARTRMTAAVSAALVGVTGYVVWRPRMLRWGATPEEAAEALPGDERTPDPRVQCTRAVTIDAPPEQVWPWLVQMGIGRAGFYTHDWLERLLFRARYVEGRHSATRIHPELQDLRVGDRTYLGSGVYVPVAELEPFRHLVGFETFVLRPLPGDRTRLLVRTRGTGYLLPAVDTIAPDAGPLPRLIHVGVRKIPGIRLLAQGFDYFVGDPLHHYMDTGLIKGVKQRAEAAATPAVDGARGTAPTRRLPPWSPWRPAGASDHADDALGDSPSGHPATIRAITAVHTLAWFSIESCMGYLLYAGFAHRSDRRAAIAGGVVAGETLVFAANRFRCPLTQLAGRLGATRAGVTDIWLPQWFAHNLPAIHVPLLVLAGSLHARNLRSRRAR